jgi:hypothetical protein
MDYICCFLQHTIIDISMEMFMLYNVQCALHIAHRAKSITNDIK